MNLPNNCAHIDNIVHSILKDNYRSIAITGCCEGDGTTSIISALAQRLLLIGKSTLIVDLNVQHPSLINAFTEANASPNPCSLDKPSLMNVDNSGIVLNGVPAPTQRAAILKLQQPGVLDEYIHIWQEQFDLILIDCPAVLSHNDKVLSSEQCCRSCDISLMVVMACRTTESSVQSALHTLTTAGANILGLIINDMINPSLRSELLRELKRLPNCLNACLKPVHKFIENNRFWAMEL